MSTPAAVSPSPALSEGGPSAHALFDRPEISHLANWAVSSHKYGFGVDNLRDGNDSTFWQSEGSQPHAIDLSFPRRLQVSSIALHMSHPRDDSYTPSKISVRAGTGVHDLQEVRYLEFNKPDGWHLIPLRPLEAAGAEGGEKEGPAIPCHFLRIIIFANHLNGKDTHVRGLKVFGPPGPRETGPESPLITASSLEEEGKNEGKKLLKLGHDGLSDYTSVNFKMHEFVR